MKITKHEAKELDANIYLCMWTFKEAQTFCSKLFEEELEKDEYWDVRWVCVTNKRNIACFVLTDNCEKKDYKGVMIHEVIHWIHYLLDYIGHPMDYDNWTEMVAYYMSYYIEKWMEFLDWLNKKNGESKSKRKWLKRVPKTALWSIHQGYG